MDDACGARWRGWRVAAQAARAAACEKLLGAFATHTIYVGGGANHLLLGRCSTPILAGVLLALPLAHWVGRCSAPEFEA